MRNTKLPVALLSVWAAVAALPASDASAQSRTSQAWRAPAPAPVYRPPAPAPSMYPKPNYGGNGGVSNQNTRPTFSQGANNQNSRPSFGQPAKQPQGLGAGGLGSRPSGGGSFSTGRSPGFQGATPSGSALGNNKFGKPSNDNRISGTSPVARPNKFGKPSNDNLLAGATPVGKPNKFGKPLSSPSPQASWSSNPSSLGARKPGDLNKSFGSAASSRLPVKRGGGGSGGGGGGGDDGGDKPPLSIKNKFNQAAAASSGKTDNAGAPGRVLKPVQNGDEIAKGASKVASVEKQAGDLRRGERIDQDVKFNRRNKFTPPDPKP